MADTPASSQDVGMASSATTQDAVMAAPAASEDAVVAAPAASEDAAVAAVTTEDAAMVAVTQEETGTDDDDPVVQECDVYLNRMYDPPDFVGDLYVLQYPLRPVYRPYGDQGELDKVELKPRSRRLKFVYKLSQGDNYDEDGVVSEKHGQKHVLSSSVVANPSCSYAVGVIHQGRMTVTPIRAVNQLRPDFEVFDKLRAQQQKAASGDFDMADAAAASAGFGTSGGGAADSSDSGQEEARIIPEADAGGASTVRVEYMPAGGATAGPSEPEDAWTRLDFYSAHSDEAKDIHQRHLVWPAAAAADAEVGGYEADHPKLRRLELDGDRETFLSAMCGQAAPSRERKAKEVEAEDGLSSYVLSRMPAERQVEAVVRHYGVVSYRQLRKRLPPNMLRTHGSDDNLMPLLQKCATLVVGNWILKSELAGFEGLEANARDMLLCLFANKKGVLLKEEYKKWEDSFGKATHRTAREEMTRNFANFDQEREAWHLKTPVDEDFIRKFPKVVQEQAKQMDGLRVQIIKKLGELRKGYSSGGKDAAVAAASSRQRFRLMGEIQKVLTLGAMTLPELRRTLQKKNTTVAIREDELLQALQHKDSEAEQVRGLWLLARTGNDDHDKFRRTLVGLFRQRDSASKKDILAEYERLHGTACALSDFQVRSLMREIAEKADRDNYVLKGTLLQKASASESQ